MDSQQPQTLWDDAVPHFDGITFDPQKDGARLGRLLDRVFYVMRDRQWRTLAEIRERTGGSEAGISARLRDLRKTRFGGYNVERRRRDGGDGLWEYQLNE